MKPILFVVLLFQCNIFFGQEKTFKNCSLKYQIDTSGLEKSAIMKLTVINLESYSVRIPKRFAMIRIQPQNAEKYDEKSKQYIEIDDSFVDVNCPKCDGRTVSLKPNKKYEYAIDLSRVYLLEKLLMEPDTRYRFNLHFDTGDFYSENKKCKVENFETPKIVYKSPL